MSGCGCGEPRKIEDRKSCCQKEPQIASQPGSTELFSNAAVAGAVSSVASSCCGPATHKHTHQEHTHEGHTDQAHINQVPSSCCEVDHKHGGRDYLLWGSLSICVAFYLAHWLMPSVLPDILQHFAHGVFELLNSMWWGIVIGLVFVGILSKIPQNMVLSVLGKGGTFNGLIRATAAGVLLDLCSHGILMVGTKLYHKGASLGQVMAFLIASPWNSFSLTLIMLALIGFKWTMAFIIFSMVIALISGWIFDLCVYKKILPANPNAFELDENFKFWPEVRKQWAGIDWSWGLLKSILKEGASGSRMVLRWLLFGVVLAALVRTFVSPEFFQEWFGPSLVGIVFTLVAATVIEVCSEGSAPIAADLMTRAHAPGNAFTFMMAGVSTDYTEILVLREATKTWKIPLFLPLITLPQILVIGYLMNGL